ncbi:hypothetical protein [Agrobacterium deltaense]|uniref:hypothetical protein n=1 Tax=Agrobacterium deltaense TaxID=1183412 RepID=UPI001C6E445C|nr:hypothetical protein [Agrobacterium deltaense]MBW9074943.1 hypothetical protein [Agrobacterium deltaense]
MNDNDKIYTIELVGSSLARHVESGIENDQGKRKNYGTTRSAIPPLCRDLIQMGHSHDAKSNIVRRCGDGSFMPVMKGNRTLRQWADLDVTESELTGPRITKFKPFDASAFDIGQCKAA